MTHLWPRMTRSGRPIAGRRAAASFPDARDGAVLPLVAVLFAVLVGSAAFAVDYGSLFAARRRVQGAADLAALVAAQLPGDADHLARQSLVDNGMTELAGLAVQSGRYAADGAVDPVARFVAGAAPPNAVRVRISRAVPLSLARLLTGIDAMTVGATATATRADVAVVSIGSRLASVQGGVANMVLGGLLGTQLSLTAMDYEALAGARLDGFKVLDALAVSLDLRAATYADVLAGEASLGDLGAALATAAVASRSGWPAISALRTVATALAGHGQRVTVGRLLAPGDLATAPVGSADPNRPLSVGAMGLLSGMAQLANGSQQVAVDLTAALPGVASARLSLAIGERPQSVESAVGPGGTVATAQTRFLLEARLTAPLGLGQVVLPIYGQLAPAEATLSAISCPWSAADTLSATVSARPGLADLAIAAVPAGWGAPGAPSPDLSRPATLLDVPGAKVTGSARAMIAAPAPRDLVFGAGDIAAGRVRTVGTTGLSGSLATSLVGGLTLDVSVGGLGLGLPSSTVRSAVAATLSAATPGLDAALDTVLQVLGVGLGQADVWVDAVRCDRSVLVQ